MFISNIINKLSAIIYKLGIIYKGYNSPSTHLITHSAHEQQPWSTNINTGSIEPLYTSDNTRATSLCLSLFLTHMSFT